MLIPTNDKSKPIEIGSRLELMIDNHLIDSINKTASLKLHKPVKQNVVFTCDQPWEGNFSGSVTFIQDQDKYRMYYRGASWPWSPESSHLCYAESSDGIKWDRPRLNLVEHNGSKDNNILLSGEASNTFVPFKDTNTNRSIDSEYKGLAKLSYPDKGLYSYSSRDGIQWRKTSILPVIKDGYFDSQNVSFWDETRELYVEFHRELKGPENSVLRLGRQLGYPGGGWSRDIMTSTSPDYKDWSKPQWLKYPSAPREQLYFNQIIPYYRAPHILVGFPGRFMAGREIAPNLPITSHKSYSYGGICDTTFMSSRDGISFNRWVEAFIRPGNKYERWIYPHTFAYYGLLITKSNTPNMNDELSIYLLDSGYWTSKGTASHIRRYSLRIDGFVSINATMNGGEFVTKPITFTGKNLLINFSTSAAGSIFVEMQDISGRAIEGFTVNDCTEIFGDNIEHVVKFNGNPDISKLESIPIRIRFILKDADLYSLRFN